MTFGHCIACTKISLVIFTVDVNISRRYPQDILFYLGTRVHEHVDPQLDRPSFNFKALLVLNKEIRHKRKIHI